jgi:UDP-N-acetylmuramate dehydrogenase
MSLKNAIEPLKNYCLKEHTTLKIGGEAKIAYLPSCVEDIYEIKNNTCGEKLTVVGEGSNLLVSSQGVEEKVIITKNLKNYSFLDENKVKVECGLKSAAFAKILLEKELTGLEFLVGIPGSIGGAVTMNSSAHGQIIENSIVSAEVIDLHTCELKTLSKEDLQLSYRHSFVEKNRHLILNATFKLEKADKKVISEKMEFHLDYRKKNHPPLTEPNAGSTFRNPEAGVYVGKLFEELGAKSWGEGGAKVSEKHANFLINAGNATSLDVSRLMHRMHSGVKEKFGYDLIAEIRYIGIPTEEEEAIWKNFTVH